MPLPPNPYDPYGTNWLRTFPTYGGYGGTVQPRATVPLYRMTPESKEPSAIGQFLSGMYGGAKEVVHKALAPIGWPKQYLVDPLTRWGAKELYGLHVPKTMTAEDVVWDAVLPKDPRRGGLGVMPDSWGKRIAIEGARMMGVSPEVIRKVELRPTVEDFIFGSAAQERGLTAPQKLARGGTVGIGTGVTGLALDPLMFAVPIAGTLARGGAAALGSRAAFRVPSPLMAAMAGPRGSRVAAELLRTQPGIRQFAFGAAQTPAGRALAERAAKQGITPMAAALESAVATPGAGRAVRAAGRALGVDPQRLMRAGEAGISRYVGLAPARTAAEKGLHYGFMGSMALGAAEAPFHAAVLAKQGDLTGAAEALGHGAVSGGMLALGIAGGRAKAARKAQALEQRRKILPAGVRIPGEASRVLPLDRVPDAVQPAAEVAAKDMARAIIEGEERGPLPAELQPYGREIATQARWIAQSVYGGRQFLKTLQQHVGDGKPGISVEAGPNGLQYIVQRSAEGKVIGGASIRDGELGTVAGGRAMGSPEPAKPIFDKMDEMGLGRGEHLTALGALNRRKMATALYPRDVMEGRRTLQSVQAEIADARKALKQAGLEDILALPAYATGGLLGKTWTPRGYTSPRERALSPGEAKTRRLAYALREGKPEAVKVAAEEMATRVGNDPNAVLIPIPDSRGRTDANRALAEAIAAKSGASVKDVLTRRAPVSSSRVRRLRGERPLSPEEHQMVTALDYDALPGSGRVFLVDNVVTQGTTLEAARRALKLPTAEGLAFARASDAPRYATDRPAEAVRLDEVEREIDQAYEKGDHAKAERLEPEALRLRGRLEERTVEEEMTRELDLGDPIATEAATVSGQLALGYHELLQLRSGKPSRFQSERDIIENLRDVLETSAMRNGTTFQATDRQILVAAEDVFRNLMERRGRLAEAPPGELERAQEWAARARPAYAAEGLPPELRRFPPVPAKTRRTVGLKGATRKPGVTDEEAHRIYTRVYREGQAEGLPAKQVAARAQRAKDDYLYDFEAAVAEPFYSQLRRVIEDPRIQKTQVAEHWLSFLRKHWKTGITGEELRWTGVERWLRGKGRERVTKEQLLDFLDTFDVEIREETLGGAGAPGAAEVQFQSDPNVLRQILPETDAARVRAAIPRPGNPARENFLKDIRDYVETEEGMAAGGTTLEAINQKWGTSVTERELREAWDKVDAVYQEGDLARFGALVTEYADVFERNEARLFGEGNQIVENANLELWNIDWRIEATPEGKFEVERPDVGITEGPFETRERAREYIRDEARMMWEEARVEDLPAEAGYARYDEPGLTLPGGTNYQEKVLSFPPKEIFAERARPDPVAPDRWDLHDAIGRHLGREWAANEAEAIRKFNQAGGRLMSPDFTASHWEDVPNVLFHLRMKDRVGPRGEKILEVEEIQSDWAEIGREEGFARPEALQADQVRYRKLQEEGTRIADEVMPLEAGAERAETQAARQIKEEATTLWDMATKVGERADPEGYIAEEAIQLFNRKWGTNLTVNKIAGLVRQYSMATPAEAVANHTIANGTRVPRAVGGPSEVRVDWERLRETERITRLGRAYPGTAYNRAARGLDFDAELKAFNEKWGTKIQRPMTRGDLLAVGDVVAGLEAQIERGPVRQAEWTIERLREQGAEWEDSGNPALEKFAQELEPLLSRMEETGVAFSTAMRDAQRVGEVSADLRRKLGTGAIGEARKLEGRLTEERLEELMTDIDDLYTTSRAEESQALNRFNEKWGANITADEAWQGSISLRNLVIQRVVEKAPKPEQATGAGRQRLQTINDELARLDRKWGGDIFSGDPVPDSMQPGGPWVENTQRWTELALKRVIKMAADEGYDKVAWLTGDRQNERYRLSTRVRDITAGKMDDTRGVPIPDVVGISATLRNGQPIDGYQWQNIARQIDGARVIENNIIVPRNLLHRLVGKKLADQINSDRGGQLGMGGERVYSGLDLEVGGHGMREFYDRIVPSVARKIAKRWGVEVKKGEFEFEDTALTAKLKYQGPELTAEELRNRVAREEDVRMTQQAEDVALLLDQGEPFASAMEINGSPHLASIIGGRMRSLEPLAKEPIHTIEIPKKMAEEVRREGFAKFAEERPAEGAEPLPMRQFLLDVYPEGSVIRERGNVYEIELPDGRRVRWELGKEHIEIDVSAFEKGHRRPPTPEELERGAPGVTYRLPNEAVVQIATRVKEARIAIHEHWHVLKHLGMLTERQQNQLNRRFKGNEEAEADAFAKWLERDRKPANNVFESIWRGVRGLYEQMTGAPEAVFRQAVRGALTAKQPAAPRLGARPPIFVQPADQRRNLNWHLAASGQKPGRKGAKYMQAPRPENALELERDGKPFFVGPLTFEQWVRKQEAWVGAEGSPELAKARAWYRDLVAAFEARFGKKDARRMLTLWAITQQRASPSAGMANLLRAEDIAKGFRPETDPRAGLAHDRLLAMMRGEQTSLGQKLADFEDASHGRTTRQWVGFSPRGGRPAPVDVHSGRDVGFVDDVVVNKVRKLFGDEIADRLVPDMVNKKGEGAPPTTRQYFYGHDFLNRLADHLNERGYDGGKWEPLEAQAVGWWGQQRMLGDVPEGVAEIFPPSISHVAAEVAPGAGSPRAKVWARVPAARQREVTEGVISDIMPDALRLAGVRAMDVVPRVGIWRQEGRPNGVVEVLGTPEGALRLAKILGYTLHQTEVWAQRVSPKSRANATGVDILSPEGYDFSARNEVLRFWQSALGRIPGLGASVVRVGENPVLRVVAEDAATVARTRAALEQWATANVDVDVTARPVEVQRTVNDWGRIRSGKAHLEGLRGVRRADLDGLSRRAAESLERRVEALEAEAPAEAPPAAPQAGVVRPGAPRGPPGEPAYATEAAPEPEAPPPPLGQPKPRGQRPRVEERVESLEESIKAQKKLGIVAEQLSLSREHRRNWDALDPEIRTILEEWDDGRWLRRMGWRETKPGEWRQTEAGRTLSDKEVMALDAVVRGRREAKELARGEWVQAKGGKNETTAWRNYIRALADYLPLERANINDGTGTARALAARARLMEAAETPDRTFLKKVLREFKGISDKDANQLVLMFETGDPRLANALRAQMAGRWKQWQTLLRAGLITPSSEIPNLLGNTIVQGIELTDQALAAGLDWAASRLRGTQRERYLGEVGAEYGAMVDAVPTAITEFLKDRFYRIYKRAWTGEVGDIDLSRRLEYQVSPFKSKALRLFATSLDALAAGDRLFRAPIAQGQLAKLAYRQAVKELGKTRGPEVEGRALEIALDVLKRPEKHAKIVNTIQSNVRRRLFQEKPWNFVDKYLRNMEHDYPWIAAVLPFVKTPANITRYAIHHSPLGLGSPEFWRAVDVLARGKERMGRGGEVMTQGEAADIVARRISGMMIFASAVAAAKMGKLTGSGPADWDERRAKMETGWRPYSWVLTDDATGEKVYIPITRFDPVSQVAGVAADLVEMPDMRDGKDIAEKAIGSIVENYSDRTYLRGMIDFTEAMSDPMRFAGNYAINIATMHIPRQLARTAQMIDPVMRDVRPLDRSIAGMPTKLKNAVVRNIPWLSKTLPARYGPTGEPIIRPGTGIPGALMRAVSPIQVSPGRPGRELEGLMADIGYVPSEMRPYMTIQGEQIMLDRESIEIQHRADRTAAHELRLLLKNPVFARLPDSIEEGGQDSKEWLIRETYQKYRALARQMILRSFRFQRQAREQISQARRERRAV